MHYEECGTPLPSAQQIKKGKAPLENPDAELKSKPRKQTEFSETKIRGRIKVLPDVGETTTPGNNAHAYKLGKLLDASSLSL